MGDMNAERALYATIAMPHRTRRGCVKRGCALLGASGYTRYCAIRRGHNGARCLPRRYNVAARVVPRRGASGVNETNGMSTWTMCVIYGNQETFKYVRSRNDNIAVSGDGRVLCQYYDALRHNNRHILPRRRW